jgi:hypothetical protein
MRRYLSLSLIVAALLASGCTGFDWCRKNNCSSCGAPPCCPPGPGGSGEPPVVGAYPPQVQTYASPTPCPNCYNR